MASKPKPPEDPVPSHYRVTVSTSVFEAGTQFNPGPTYTVKKAVFDKIASAVRTQEPLFLE